MKSQQVTLIIFRAEQGQNQVDQAKMAAYFEVAEACKDALSIYPMHTHLHLVTKLHAAMNCHVHINDPAATNK